ncbi:MAG: hypothetical protein HY331_11750 [Chloroflexi bacterium]|nr:hypothetical protein [Chloroflexota bacterium]
MATVVSIDGSETLATLRKRIDTADDAEVVLTPDPGVRLRDALALRLLRRQATRAGKAVILVSPDARSRQIARGEGIPAFASVEALRRAGLRGPFEPWGGIARPGRRPGVSPLAIVAALGSSAVVALIAALAALYVVPSATITLVPATELMSQAVEVTAGYDVREAAGTRIPARQLAVQFEVVGEAVTSGERVGPGDRAAGEVTFVNRAASEIAVQRGTVLVASARGSRYLTVSDVAVPARQWSNVRGGVLAEEAGLMGNVEPFAVNQILHPVAAASLTVFNEKPLTGGSDRIVNFVTAEDQNHLKATLLDRAREQAFSALMAAKRADESITPETLALTIADEQFDRAVGEEAQKLALRLQVVVSGLVYDESQADLAARRALEQAVPSGWTIAPGSVGTKPLVTVGWSERSATFQVLAQATIWPLVDAERVRREARGKPAADAERDVAELVKLERPPRVRIAPTWAETVPIFGPRIGVEVVQPGERR